MKPKPSKRWAARIARLKAEGALERRSYELTAATGRPHCPKCSAMLALEGWHCAACGHVTDPDRLMDIYTTPKRDPSSGRTGIFTTTRANFWIPGVHGTVYLLMCVWLEGRPER